MIQSCVTLTMSIAPMSPPARPMAVVNSPSVPVRLDSFTRKVKLLLALGVLGIVSGAVESLFRVKIAGADEAHSNANERVVQAVFRTERG